MPGRLNLEKALVLVAAQEEGVGIGRIRLRQIVDASAESLIPFVRESVVPGGTVHTDGWLSYLPLKNVVTRVEISASEIAKLNLIPEVFRGDWSYSVLSQ